MSSTTIPTRSGRIVPRAAVSTLLAALAVAAVTALALLALTGAVADSTARPATRIDGSQMPTPPWLERYLAPRVTDGSQMPTPPWLERYLDTQVANGGSGEPAAPGATGSANRGPY